MAIAAHAIGEGARALTEGTSYEPKPPILFWAAPSPETLQIGGCVPDGFLDRGAFGGIHSSSLAGTQTVALSANLIVPPRAPTYPKVF